MKQFIYLLAMVSLPLRHLCLTSPYGVRVHPLTGSYTVHTGVDLRACFDTVYAVLDSRISSITYDRALGLSIKITNGPLCATYGHLSQFFIGKGDTVLAGQPLGISGSTGRVTAPHLHFAVQFQSHYIDPLAFLLAAVSNNQ
jgi:murein DD-endopeptidase MepM/ murein hydrolase activator NlpD